MPKKFALRQSKSGLIWWHCGGNCIAHPEVSGEERWTSARIAAELEKIGIPYVVDERRNVIGRIETGRPGGRLALRADFDALAVTEATGLPYASENPGVMHACGHDGHVAGLMGAARLLWQMRDCLNGTVYLCFQMGEEMGWGAAEVIRYLKQQGGVDFAAGIHLMPEWKPGEFVCMEGPFMAGVLAGTSMSQAEADTAVRRGTRWIPSARQQRSCCVWVRCRGLGDRHLSNLWSAPAGLWPGRRGM